jgi:hypothetical protein
MNKQAMRWVGALALGTVCANCATPSEDARQDQVQVGPDGASRAAPSGSEARRLIGQILADADLSPRSLQAILGQPLAPTVNPTTVSWTTRLLSGPFDGVELRTLDSRADWRLVNLDVREGVALAYGEFAGDVIPPGTPVSDLNPHIPPEGTISYVVEQGPRQTVHFQFTARSLTLRAVSVHRNTD